ncbi:MAG: hypothetical protein ACHP7J_06350 [Terriglobales bacterium]
MNRIGAWVLAIMVCAGTGVVAQDAVVSMDDEPHYSRVFSNDYCRAYIIDLGRLEQTKPVAYKHDWVRMTLGGSVEQAWGGTLFSSKGYEDPEGYYISFLFPVDRLTLRNPHNEPYQSLIVEIMQSDDSRNRVRDTSLDPFAMKLGPGVDSHASYVTSLTKTSVEIVNVQLLGGDAKEIASRGIGALFVAMTDVELQRGLKGEEAKDLKLGKGEVRWLPAGGSATFRNMGKEQARFVILELK